MNLQMPTLDELKDLQELTVNYYNDNAAAIQESYLNRNEFYNIFLTHIPLKGHILDAGCGSGQDSKYFLNLGYQVTSFDASIKMVHLTNLLTHQPAFHLRFQEDLVFPKLFDGFWASASLLHIHSLELNSVIRKLLNILKKGGIGYMSFKYGQGDIIRNGRLFSMHTQKSLSHVLKEFSEIEILHLTKTEDLRVNKSLEYWIHCVLKKMILF